MRSAVVITENFVMGTGITLLLKSFDFTDVQLTKSFSDARILTSEETDLVILPFELINTLKIGEDSDGISFGREIKQHFPEIKLIYTKANFESFDIRVARSVGADALCRTKDKDLTNAIQKVLANKTYYPQNIISHSGFSFREVQITKLLIKEYSNREIAEMLEISIHTVKFHRKSILKKADARSLAGLTLFAINNHIVEI